MGRRLAGALALAAIAAGTGTARADTALGLYKTVPTPKNGIQATLFINAATNPLALLVTVCAADASVIVRTSADAVLAILAAKQCITLARPFAPGENLTVNGGSETSPATGTYSISRL